MQNASIYMQMQKEKNGEMASAVFPNSDGKNEMKMFHHEENATGKQEVQRQKKKKKAQLEKVWAHSPTHSLCPWLMNVGLMHVGAAPLRMPSHLLRVPLSARELREPSEPW